MQRRYLAFLGLLVVLSFVSPVHANEQSFEDWAENFKARAAAEGISERVLEEAFTDLVPNETVIKLDRKQPEGTISLKQYLKNTVTPRRIEKGRAMLQEHQELLKKVGKEYGVQPEYIVALWAIESNFGSNKGNFSVVESLATLAYDGRRAELFGRELIAALKIVDREHLAPADLLGSWAGAMGDCQFMPTTYLRHAVDGDGDGKRNIWGNEADVFASVANYLHSLNWDPKQSWGAAVKAPKDFKASEANLKRGKTASQWRKHGFTYAKNGKKVARGDETLYAVYPGSHAEGVYLVSENFQALLKWNRSRYFATAVGTLADAIGE